MRAERYRHMRGNVSTLTYHLVWCPKYRRKVLTGVVADRLSTLLHERAAALHCEIVPLDVQPDHVHLALHAPPTLAPQQIAHQLKGFTARSFRAAFPRCAVACRRYGAVRTTSGARGRWRPSNATLY